MSYSFEACVVSIVVYQWRQSFGVSWGYHLQENCIMGYLLLCWSNYKTSQAERKLAVIKTHWLWHIFAQKLIKWKSTLQFNNIISGIWFLIMIFSGEITSANIFSNCICSFKMAKTENIRLSLKPTGISFTAVNK